jgi:hypothetical protein
MPPPEAQGKLPRILLLGSRVNKPTSGAESFVEWHHGGGKSRQERREREEKPYVCGTTLPSDHLLRAGLRVFVVALPLYALGLSPGAIIGFGPFLAALVVLALTAGKAGVVALLRRMVRWRMAPLWYAVALLLPVAIALGATVLNVLLGARPPSSAELGAWPNLIPTYFLLLLILGIGGAPGRSRDGAVTPS